MRSNSMFSIFIGSVLTVYLSFVPADLAAQDQAEQSPAALPRFEEVVAFDLTLDRLAAQVEAGDTGAIPKDRYLMINGIVSSRQLVNEDEQEYLGILELSSGEWVDGEELHLYRLYAQLRGPQFFGTVPKPRSRESSANEIPLHSHVLLIGRYLGYGQDEQGNRFPVLQAVEVRVLQ
ncbi:MAG: hypothetical protein K9M94_15100 [Spirochaetia bacterium]|nr:hypothetical protein [Spirochaetia bacterium]